MHEFSLMQAILDLAHEEMHSHGASKLKVLRVRWGTLSNVVPESMQMAFSALTQETADQDAKLELVEELLHLRCAQCGHEFSPSGRPGLFMPCPACEELTAFSVTAGQEVWLDHLEAE